MNLLFGIPIVIIAAIVQSSVLPRFPIMGLTPNLMLLIVVAWSILRGPNNGMVWAAIGGVALDLASSSFFGITPLPLLLAAIIAGFAYNRKGHGLLFISIISILSIIVYQAIYPVLLVIMGYIVIWPEAFREIILPLLFIHGLLLPIVFLTMSSLSLFLGRQEPRISQWESSSNGNI
ncbi:MAG: rod shape-determining protein MreD [Anaerolineales bacterium]|nr:rod shape-determining protein MreD [Anaerolineales bacterium]